MKVHLNQIPPEGLRVEGEESADFLDLESEEIRAVGPLSYALDVGLSEGGLFATGTLSVDLEFQCVSCLGHFVRPIRLEEFAMQTELQRGESVDLTPFVREDIVLALPPHPHCDWDGRKVCIGVQHAFDEPVAPELDVWGELDKLKISKKK